MATERTVLLTFHYHLPVGVSDEVFEVIYLSKLMPFFQILNAYPQIPFALHFSGTLLYKIERIHGEIFMLISDMVQRKQVELISGGFYEPMMPFLLHQDRIGQIELLTTYLRKQFGKRAYGCWIPGAAWEQSLVSAIAQSSLQYTFVDEKKFIEAGFNEDVYNLPCVSEDKGKTITVFPLFTSLRDKIRNTGAEAAFTTLLEGRHKNKFVRTIFPDFFPHKDSVHTASDTYINKFFEDISKFNGQINFSLPGKEEKNSDSLQKIYFPQTANKKYLVDYPEAGLVYSKMTRIRALIEQLKGDKERKKSAQEELWKAQECSLFCTELQCNNEVDTGREHYPGIYNAALRSVSYRAMLEAERMIRDKPEWKSSLTTLDFDFDGVNEYIFQSELMNCFVRVKGAALFELDYIPKTWNYQNTIALAAAPRGTESTFFDILAPFDYNIKTGLNKTLRVPGNEMFAETSMDRIHQSASFFSGAREGAFGGLEIIKNYKLNNNLFTVNYKIVNTLAKKQAFKFITKINLSFPGTDEKILRMFGYSSYTSFSNNGEKIAVPNNQTLISGIEAIDFQDLYNEAIINISSDSAFDANLVHVMAKYKNPLDEVDDVYQWTCIFAEKLISLEAGEAVSFCFRLGIFH